MWEWSNHNSKNKNKTATSLLSAYDDLSLNPPSDLTPSSSVPQIENDGILGMSEMQNTIETMMVKFNLRQMTLIKKDYTPHTWEEMYSIFNEYQRARNAFLKLIGYSNEEECQKLGLDEDDIEELKEGITPENFNTHLKLPFDFGGNLMLSNFSFIKTHKTHSNIHRILDFQINNGFLLKHKKIYIPYFEGKFYYD